MASKRTIQSLIIGAALIGIAFWGLSSFAHQTAQASAEAETIHDPLIIEGLNHLSELTDPIQLPNGDSLSGAALAQFILDSYIPLMWGSDKICGGGSCSLMYCSAAGECSYENGQPGIDPIYLNPSIKEQGSGMIDRLANELAHEAFHRMGYFGNAQISQLEEYWAFYIGSQIGRDSWLKFDNTDPQDPEQLQRWFYLNGMQGYLSLPAYPGSTDQASPANTSQLSNAEASE
jgi:hypothetical protein